MELPYRAEEENGFREQSSSAKSRFINSGHLKDYFLFTPQLLVMYVVREAFILYQVKFVVLLCFS